MKPSDWTGRVGSSWAQEWRRTDRSFAALDPALLAAILAAAPSGSPWVLDIGSGAGATSLALAAARPDARIVGVDLSPELVAVADGRARERGAAGCDFDVGDVVAGAAALGPIDLLVSRHGVMFFEDPVSAFAGLAEAAAPGAALVFSCFADLDDNPWATETVPPAPAAASGSPSPGPFAFADPVRVADILTRAGWHDAQLTHVPFAYVAGEGPDPVADALAFFRRIGPAARTLADADEPERKDLEARIAAACERRRDGDRVVFPAAAWLWSARKGDHR